MRKVLIALASVFAVAAFAVPVALATITTTFNAAAAPNGTHLQTGTIGCTVDPGTLLVTCSAYELGGVGNAGRVGHIERDLHSDSAMPEPRRPDRRRQVSGRERADDHR